MCTISAALDQGGCRISAALDQGGGSTSAASDEGAALFLRHQIKEAAVFLRHSTKKAVEFLRHQISGAQNFCGFRSYQINFCDFFFYFQIASAVKTQEFNRFLKTHRQRLNIFVRKRFLEKNKILGKS